MVAFLVCRRFLPSNKGYTIYNRHYRYYKSASFLVNLSLMAFSSSVISESGNRLKDVGKWIPRPSISFLFRLINADAKQWNI